MTPFAASPIAPVVLWLRPHHSTVDVTINVYSPLSDRDRVSQTPFLARNRDMNDRARGYTILPSGEMRWLTPYPGEGP